MKERRKSPEAVSSGEELERGNYERGLETAPLDFPEVEEQPAVEGLPKKLQSVLESEPFGSWSQQPGQPAVERYGLAADAEQTASTFCSTAREKSEAAQSLQGKTLGQCGCMLLQTLLEVLPLRSKSTGYRDRLSLFPLPTSRRVLGDCLSLEEDDDLSWLLCTVLSLNSLWGDEIHYDGDPTSVQVHCLGELLKSVRSFTALKTVVEKFDWNDFFRVRTVDYQGEEVKVASWVSWENLAPALPKEIGLVPLENVCTLGCKHYVESIDHFLLPREDWKMGKAPKVMVDDDSWGDVCIGLLKAGVCILLEEDEVFKVDGVPLLNGMFGVSKDEYTGDGVEIMRLIMNLIPFNRLCRPLAGDIDTLPSWSLMSPFFLQPTENLLVSSEDVKCFFYTLSLPSCWSKYLAFNKVVPASALPTEHQGKTMYIASRVLPMGFVNSVSIAQHVHRNLVLGGHGSLGSSEANAPGGELRKDRTFPAHNPLWRVYLDNYDLLEKVEATDMVQKQGTLAPGVLALREQYELWQVPRNEKKAVQRSAYCEMQGATVDGAQGSAFPRETKLAKYFALSFQLGHSKWASQKQWQVACGGLVYFCMFRRPLLGTLNRVWMHIEGYARRHVRKLLTPEDCRVEIFRFLGLLPVARLNFRLGMHSLVTCSDASTTGGGICASVSTTPFGKMVSQGGLRGEEGRSWEPNGILVVGMFDGIGALRVALDLVGVQVLGYVSVERMECARRVVESHYPGVISLDDVEQITAEDVKSWSMRFSQCSAVLLGAGPPCQGVSGLNADRRGALKDARSSLFTHVPRVRSLLRQYFPWCPVFSLMESVSSMDIADRTVMSEAFGESPYQCDAGYMTWAHRPRLYWLDWEISADEGVQVEPTTDGSPTRLWFTAEQPLELVVKKGWHKVDLNNSFPTFTTARPSEQPGRKPAGIRQCSDLDLARWKADSHRFPPYQYCYHNCVENKKGEVRVLSCEEREIILGFPLDYTASCLPKGKRGSVEWSDTRLTLLGNTWSVPVVAVLLGQLFHPLGLCAHAPPQRVIDHTFAQKVGSIQGRLLRLPLNALASDSDDRSMDLAHRLGNLISIKGEDIMLVTPTTQLSKFHRLRATVPGKLWKWKVVSGWRWRHGTEHINALELRAILTSVRWRLEHQGHIASRFIHLTDSLVCLHCLSRGRSSSRKLRRTMARINALLLAGNLQPVWGYIHTDQNPADRPSRWGRRLKTRFRNAKKSSA